MLAARNDDRTERDMALLMLGEKEKRGMAEEEGVEGKAEEGMLARSTEWRERVRLWETMESRRAFVLAICGLKGAEEADREKRTE